MNENGRKGQQREKRNLTPGRKQARKQANKLTDLAKERRDAPDLSTAPETKQIAVSALTVSSVSSMSVASSRPFTLLTILYSSTNEVGSRARLNVGISACPGAQRKSLETSDEHNTRASQEIHRNFGTYLVYGSCQDDSSPT